MNQEALHNARHTLAHLLAAAVVDLYPHAKPTLGPAIDTGFYYDFDFSNGAKPTTDDLQRIEQKMREFLKQWDTVLPEQVTEKQARELFKNNPYKLELIDEIVAEGDTISVYNSGLSNQDDLSTDTALFFDLCGGGHVSTPNKDLKDIGFTLDRVAGAYWRGDEKNTMLTRIYGLAFDNKEALKQYQDELEEAKRRDHRKLGKEQDLFTFSELVGPGLPLWTPHGTIIRHELDTFVWELRKKHDYQRVAIPHITKKDLYEKSGHWEKFGEELFKVLTREGKQYALKPMNCPHHTQIFARRPHSYREMPQRYAETTMVYRDEQSGELGGLTRVLSITQDDSHVFCRRSQVKEEFMRIWDIVDTLYSTFNFTLKTQLSFHNPDEMEKYLGDSDIWNNAESSLRDIAKERKADFTEVKGEAAMYGPKLDFMATDSLGREHQVATIQLDFNLPERFDLTCVNEEGEHERIVMVHAAIMGSLERFTAVIVEHLAGHLPVWIAPVQLRVLPIAQGHTDFANDAYTQFKDAGIRVAFDDASESFGRRVRSCKVDKIPFYTCIGNEEVSSQSLSLETPDGTKIEGTIPELISYLQTKIKDRT